MQFIVEKTIDTMLENVVSITSDSSGDFIRGVNRGTLALLNALIAHIEEE